MLPYCSSILGWANQAVDFWDACENTWLESSGALDERAVLLPDISSSLIRCPGAHGVEQSKSRLKNTTKRNLLQTRGGAESPSQNIDAPFSVGPRAKRLQARKPIQEPRSVGRFLGGVCLDPR